MRMILLDSGDAKLRQKLSQVGELMMLADHPVVKAFQAGELKEIPARLEVDALLLHEGTFMSSNAGKVTVTREDLVGMSSNHSSLVKLAARRLGKGPPIQADHSDKAIHTVGRLNGDFEVRQMPITVGGETKELSALVGPLTFLGRENVERVLDGRFSELSVGFTGKGDTATVVETSVTPFPAAEGAAILSEGDPEEVKTALTAVRTVLMACPEGVYSARWACERAIGAFLTVVEFLGTDIEGSDEELESKMKAAVEDLLSVLQNRLRGLFPEATLSFHTEAIHMSDKLPEGALSAEEATTLTTRATEAEEKATKLAAEAEQLKAERLASDFTRGLDWLLAASKITPAERKQIEEANPVAKGRDVVEAQLAAFAMRNGTTVDLSQRGDPTKGTPTGDETRDEGRAEDRNRLSKRFGRKGGESEAAAIARAAGEGAAKAVAEALAK